MGTDFPERGEDRIPRGIIASLIRVKTAKVLTGEQSRKLREMHEKMMEEGGMMERSMNRACA